MNSRRQAQSPAVQSTSQTIYSTQLSKPTIYLSENPVQETARWFYNRGFNPIPQPYGEKLGYPWKQSQYVRLHSDHPQYGLFALFAGRCNIAVMTGRTSGNLFIFDCESPDVFDFHLQQFVARSVYPWLVKTSRGGHLWVRCAEGEVTSLKPGRLYQAEIRGNGGYVLVPPSVNAETGVIYEWLDKAGETPPVVSIHLIDWLIDQHGQPIELKAAEKRPRQVKSQRSPLLSSTRDYLTNGHNLPEGERHDRLITAACDYAANGFDKATAYRDLEPIARASGLPSPHDANEISRAIEWAYGAPRTSYRQGPAIPQWQYAQCFADSHNWYSLPASRKTMFYALIDRAQMGSNSNSTFRASVREGAKTARCSTNTARAALDDLKNSSPPLICYAGKDETSSANLWRFSEYVVKSGRYLMKGGSVAPRGASVTADAVHALSLSKQVQKRGIDTLKGNSTALGYGVSVSRFSDVAERGALGHLGFHVYRVLLTFTEPIRPSQLAAVGGVTDGQIRHILNKLLQFGLAERVARGQWVGYPATDEQLLERVARPTGKLGKGEARAALFTAERQIQIGQRILKAIQKRQNNNEFVFGTSAEDGIFELGKSA
jgi:hypothetical protein